MKELSPQILAMYLGCPCKIVECSTKEARAHISEPHSILNVNLLRLVIYGEAKVKPILRRLSSMTEEEAREHFPVGTDTESEYKPSLEGGWDITYFIATPEGTFTNTYELRWHSLSPSQFLTLLKAGFDLFALLENELAQEKI